MTNSLNKMSTSQIIPMFITRPKSPKVSILRGLVMNFRIGFMKKFINPKINPAINKSFQEPINSTPAIKRLANQIPRIPEIMVIKSFCITL